MEQRALQIFNHNAEPFGFMIQCPKCLWWTNSPRFHAATCQFRDYTLCQTCMGSGYSNHPDSGEVCQACKGQGVEA